MSIGNDEDGFPAILLIPHLGLPKAYLAGETEASMLRRVMLLFIKEADNLVRQPYTLVYGHSQLSWTGQREIVFNIYQMLPRRYKKNVRHLYLVHPSIGVKVFFEFAKVFLSSKFFKKLHKVEHNTLICMRSCVMHGLCLSALTIFNIIFVQLKDIATLQAVMNHSLLPLPPSFLLAEDEEKKTSSSTGSSPVILPLSSMFIDSLGAPQLLFNCISFIRGAGLATEGIFRVPGDSMVTSLAMQRLHDLADMSTIIINSAATSASSSSYARLHVESVFDAASIMNKMLSALPEPLFTYDAYDNIMREAMKLEGDISTSAAFRTHVDSTTKSLPVANIKTLNFLITFLREVADCSETNKMTAGNLAIVFGPTLLRPRVQVRVYIWHCLCMYLHACV